MINVADESVTGNFRHYHNDSETLLVSRCGDTYINYHSSGCQSGRQTYAVMGETHKPAKFEKKLGALL